MANEVEKIEEEDGINLEKFGLIFLDHWYWFVGAVLITLSVACVYILKTTPIFTRTTQLLIKDEKSNSGGAASIMQDFRDLGMLGSNTNITNEILTISAPVMMERVVKRLNLDVDITTKDGLKTIPLYTYSPIKIEFANPVDEETFYQFNLHLNDKNEAIITDLQIDDEDPLETTFKAVVNGTYIKSPIGSFKVSRTSQWDDEYLDNDFIITKYPLTYISRYYSNALGVNLSDKDATVIDLSISDAVISRADDILLTLIDVYNENWVKEKNRMAESTNVFIDERLESITKELGNVDDDISNFKSKNLLPDMQASLAKDYAQSTTNYNSLLQLHNELSMANFINQYMSDKTKQDQLLPTNVGLSSNGVETMITAYNKMMLEKGTLLMNSTEDSPMVKDMDRKLEAQRTAIHRSLDNLVAQLKKQISNIERSERDINAQIATAPRHVKVLQSVERQQKVKEALYIFLLQKREENELSRTYTAWNTSIIQPPTGSQFPTSPRKMLILLVAIVAGLGIPAAILIIKETMDTKVRGRKDLEGMAIPFLGEIPNMCGKKHWWEKQKNVKRQVVVEANNRDIINESFRILRTKLEYFSTINKKEENKVVMLTSFNPGSGKSFISGNLAMTYALKGKKVLAIDMDLRHCSLSSMLPRHAAKGLSSYLNESENDINQLIVKDGFGKNVDVLPVGVIPPNPSEALYSERLETLFQEMRQKYDYIFMDCPPIEIVADASIISKYADISLFVVRAGLMDRRALKDVDELYKEQKYKHLCILLNGTDYVSGKYGQYRYGYKYGYSYNYGSNYYEGGKRKKK